MATARRSGVAVSSLVVQSLWPVPERALTEAMDGVQTVLVPELNLGQYRREVERLAAGRRVVGINRIDGELIAPDAIVEVIS